ncbi:MAG: hypothetical protein KDD22_08010, partial [Bdellovibrionales bacterium]|nr:hypothetical protein [Bdellovibrionales bacterium]
CHNKSQNQSLSANDFINLFFNGKSFSERALVLSYLACTQIAHLETTRFRPRIEALQQKYFLKDSNA